VPRILIGTDVLRLSLAEAKIEFEREFLGRQLRRHHSVAACAKAIGIDRAHLHRKMKQLDIAPRVTYGIDGTKPRRR
jgi:transcriptional regulator with PAS, ATPase and Fis domain